MSEISNELWVRRWIAKVAFTFGLALGVLIGFILAFKVQP